MFVLGRRFSAPGCAQWGVLNAVGGADPASQHPVLAPLFYFCIFRLKNKRQTAAGQGLLMMSSFKLPEAGVTSIWHIVTRGC